jgi:hypothetical protein
MAPIHQLSFQSSKHRQIIKHFSKTLLANLPVKDDKPSDIQTFIQQTQLSGIQKHLYLLHQRQVKQDLTDSAPLDLQNLLPSLLSPLTSIPLLSLTRRIPTNRTPNTHFRILLQRKLQLPVLPPNMHYQPCICCSKALLDPYGDHLFSCQAALKIPIHNRLRDTCFHILTKLAQIANITSTVTDVQLHQGAILRQAVLFSTVATRF